MRIQKETANAKINLYLDVTSLREDGFHNIKSIMHSVSLCDDISVAYSPSKKTSIRLSVSGCKFLPTDSRNLAYRAAALFLERAGLAAELDISICKRIPISAGLAGGSADAAAVLRALNKIFDRIFAERALLSMAAELGSDVPFCLKRKTALCEGRGEIMTELDTPLFCHFVIANPNEFVSTPAAYKRLDALYSSFDGSKQTGGVAAYNRLEAELKAGKIETLFNVFESAVLPECKGAESIKKTLSELGAAALMSGSGPSVFGIFSDKESAENAVKCLFDSGVTAFYAHSV